MFDANNKDIKQSQWRRSSVFIVNSEQISHLFLKFLSLILSKQIFADTSLHYNNVSNLVMLS